MHALGNELGIKAINRRTFRPEQVLGPSANRTEWLSLQQHRSSIETA
jgi:hypothetical protein